MLNPRPHGYEPIVGARGSFRVRIGDYRVIDEIDERSRVIAIVRIGHRRDVYR
jgi:mRNA interferase RelE/StbE